MGLYLNTDDGQQIPLASNAGWSNVGAWLDGLDPDDYPDAIHLWEHGWAEPVGDLRGQLASAMKASPAEGDAAKTVGELLAELRGLAEDGAVVVSDGLAQDEPASESFDRALKESGFTGEITDKRGAKRHYVDGKQVKGTAQEPVGETPSKQAEPPKAATRQSPEEAAKDYAENGTKAKAFKEWFGDWEGDPKKASKVVKADGSPQETHSVEGSRVSKNGKPVIVYHGTSASFDEFAKAKQDNIGFWFSENEDLAKTYGRKMKAVYLNVRNPCDYGRFTETQAKVAQQWQKDNKGSAIDDGWKEIHSRTEELLKGDGFDGIFDYGGPGRNVWIVFNPTQIKAVDNIGTFDPNNPKMREDRSRLVRTTITDKNGVTRHVWVHPDDEPTERPSASLDDHGQPVDKHITTISGPDAIVPHALTALAKDFPDEARDATTWEKVKTLAGKIHEAIQAALVRISPHVLPVVTAIFDTPDDLSKFGYAPTSSGLQHGAHIDPIRDATGIGSHLFTSLATKVLAHGLVWAKGKLSEGEAEAVAAQAADWILAALEAVNESLGLDVTLSRDAILEAVKTKMAK